LRTRSPRSTYEPQRDRSDAHAPAAGRGGARHADRQPPATPA
jgi:hypothetical protein